ncbi:hypothetical protein PAXINDRAFT_20661 [Paxillus involutus ATCC 200175]|uniref:Uncharacterized protein n=1 Tax=Paxillus involutus ATCC 200175 TaxID=664439 RepID=A0A0C9SUL0_PAXIN|nr:hypothetical protein PAXINDRAFT_20661 [Paxillus involutus ATCC 200175]
MPAIRQSSLDLDYRPGVRVGPSLTFSPFRRGALITPVLTRRELDSAARKRPTSASYRVASEAILLQRIFAHAFSQSTSPTSILRVSKNFNSLARPIFLRNITIHTEAALTRIIQGTFLPLKDRRHVVCIQFNSFPVKSSFESLGANPTPRPFAFPNIRTVRFAFSMGIPLPPDRRDVDQMVIIDALVNGYLQARLFESICAGRLNPTRFEWVPRRKPQCSGLRTAAGSDVSGASIDSKLDESFRILGMTWGLWSLLQSWTRLETIELVGLCLLEMETFDHCTISLPCHKVIISSCALGTGGLNDPWHFLAGPGRMVGSLQCGDLVLRNYSYPTCSVQDSSTSLNCFLGLLYPSSVFNTRPILRRLPHLSNGCETSVRHPCEAVLRSPPSSSNRGLVNVTAPSVTFDRSFQEADLSLIESISLESIPVCQLNASLPDPPRLGAPELSNYVPFPSQSIEATPTHAALTNPAATLTIPIMSVLDYNFSAFTVSSDSEVTNLKDSDVDIIEVELLPVAVHRRWILPIPLPQSLPIVGLSTFERARFHVSSVVTGACHAMLGFLIEMLDKIPAHHRRRQLRECEISNWQAKGCLNVT